MKKSVISFLVVFILIFAIDSTITSGEGELGQGGASCPMPTMRQCVLNYVESDTAWQECGDFDDDGYNEWGSWNWRDAGTSDLVDFQSSFGYLNICAHASYCSNGYCSPCSTACDNVCNYGGGCYYDPNTGLGDPDCENINLGYSGECCGNGECGDSETCSTCSSDCGLCSCTDLGGEGCTQSVDPPGESLVNDNGWCISNYGYQNLYNCVSCNSGYSWELNNCEIICNPNYNNPCTSSPNTCGQTNPGTYDCDGICSATTPPPPSYLGDSCGCQNTGTYDCNSVCQGATTTETSCTDSIDNNCDGRSDYDSSDTRPGDSSCAVSVNSISVSDTTPTENTNIDVLCITSVSGINSVKASIGSTQCNGDSLGSAWSGNTYTFKNCNVGSSGSKTVTCTIDTTKSYQSGTDKTTTISPTQTTCTQAGGHGCTPGVTTGETSISSGDSWCISNLGYPNCVSCNSGYSWELNNCEIICNPNYNNPCTSSPNTCGQTSPGTYDCNGVCSATTPPPPSYLGDSCGCQNTGTYDCDQNCVGESPPQEVCTDSIDNDCDGDIDYDSIDGTHGDNNCPINVGSISAPNSASANTNIGVSCTTNPGDINSVDLFIDQNMNAVYETSEKCSFSMWNGNEAIFTCFTGPPGTKNIKCEIDSTKSYQSGPDEIRSIEIIVTPCSSYSSSTCESDSNCDWCEECSGTKYSGALSRCVESGTCTHYCSKDQCSASCDANIGGCIDSCNLNSLTTYYCNTGCGCTISSTYSCNVNNHVNCETQICGTNIYKCTNDGANWGWRTTPPTENCYDEIDNDCDTLINYLDTIDCPKKSNNQPCLLNSDCLSDYCKLETCSEKDCDYYGGNGCTPGVTTGETSISSGDSWCISNSGYSNCVSCNQDYAWDVNNCIYTLDNIAPTINLLNTAANEKCTSGETINFQCTATDADTGIKANSVKLWVGECDGTTCFPSRSWYPGQTGTTYADGAIMTEVTTDRYDKSITLLSSSDGKYIAVTCGAEDNSNNLGWSDNGVNDNIHYPYCYVEPALPSEGDSCSSDTDCERTITGFYCTPLDLGEQHCCPVRYKWDSEFNKCTGSDNCDQVSQNKIINAAKYAFSNFATQIFAQIGITSQKTEMKKYTHGTAVSCSSNQVCCGFDLGDTEENYECVEETKCIHQY